MWNVGAVNNPHSAEQDNNADLCAAAAPSPNRGSCLLSKLHAAMPYLLLPSILSMCHDNMTLDDDDDVNVMQ